MESCKGRIHSIETFSTVDGPGIRSVIFFQGCPLRCQYCHNPDTWDANGGTEKSVQELVAFLERYRPYYQASGGGVTLSGGEISMQPAFAKALLQELRNRGFHVALDTSGWASTTVLQDLLQYADLVLLDIKHIDTAKHRQITGRDNAPVLQAAKLVTQMGIPLWVRHVLIPGVTDDIASLDALGEFLRELPTLERVDILPYHRLGEHKWEALGMEYPLAGTPNPSKEQLEAAKSLMRRHGLPVDGNTQEVKTSEFSHAS